MKTSFEPFLFTTCYKDTTSQGSLKYQTAHLSARLIPVRYRKDHTDTTASAYPDTSNSVFIKDLQFEKKSIQKSACTGAHLFQSEPSLECKAAEPALSPKTLFFLICSCPPHKYSDTSKQREKLKKKKRKGTKNQPNLLRFNRDKLLG